MIKITLTRSQTRKKALCCAFRKKNTSLPSKYKNATVTYETDATYNHVPSKPKVLFVFNDTSATFAAFLYPPSDKRVRVRKRVKEKVSLGCMCR